MGLSKERQKIYEMARQAYITEGVDIGKISDGMGVPVRTLHRWKKGLMGQKHWDTQREEIVKEAEKKMAQNGTPVVSDVDIVTENLLLIRRTKKRYLDQLNDQVNQKDVSPTALAALMDREIKLRAMSGSTNKQKEEIKTVLKAVIDALPNEHQEKALDAIRKAFTEQLF
tara:strand:- start:784 stop:1293 length:510 start_codon:yes stop_codon:yes gene_type:complete